MLMHRSATVFEFVLSEPTFRGWVKTALQQELGRPSVGVKYRVTFPATLESPYVYKLGPDVLVRGTDAVGEDAWIELSSHGVIQPMWIASLAVRAMVLRCAAGASLSVQERPNGALLIDLGEL